MPPVPSAVVEHAVQHMLCASLQQLRLFRVLSTIARGSPRFFCHCAFFSGLVCEPGSMQMVASLHSDHLGMGMALQTFLDSDVWTAESIPVVSIQRLPVFWVRTVRLVILGMASPLCTTAAAALSLLHGGMSV
jgi:hypothetical protein